MARCKRRGGSTKKVLICIAKDKNDDTQEKMDRQVLNFLFIPFPILFILFD